MTRIPMRRKALSLFRFMLLPLAMSVVTLLVAHTCHAAQHGECTCTVSICELTERSLGVWLRRVAVVRHNFTDLVDLQRACLYHVRRCMHGLLLSLTHYGCLLSAYGH